MVDEGQGREGRKERVEKRGPERGDQYVHCAMHKCIMVKVGGRENHRKHVGLQNTEILRNKGENLAK